MESYFTPDFFIGNRRRLKELFTGKAPIVIAANGLMQRNNDQAYPFRQDSNFWYLTGIDEPDLLLVLDKEREYLIVPDRHEVREFFDGSLQHEQLTKRSGIKEIIDAKEGWKRLGTRVARAKHVATLAAPKPYADYYDFYTNPARATLSEKLKEYNPDIELLDLREHFIRMRMIKQPPELEALRASIRLTVATIKKLHKKLPNMSYENEAEAFITSEFRKKGARHGYDPIIGGGVNGCTLHYLANNDKLTPKKLVLVDVGAESELYSADITRTYVLGAPTKRQLAIHKAVLETQNYAFSLLKPGVTIKQNELKIEQFIGEKLRALGLIKSIEHDEVRRYYPHALSHYLGLDLHDLGDYEAPLAPGMVLTVEPGIYVPEEGIGVRIEDDVLITEKGIKILSAGLPRELS